MNWTEKLSSSLRVIGVVPYMFIVFAPSLILTVFNIYFNLSVFETVGTALDLSYGYQKKLKWFVYLSSVLLIMRPLIQELFHQTNGSINKTEEYYLELMKFVGIGILCIGGATYITSYLISDIKVPVYGDIKNPTWIQTILGEKQKIGTRSINGFEFALDLAAMFASYFTETLAGFMLITSKDILFPNAKTSNKSDNSKKPESDNERVVPISTSAKHVLIRLSDLSKKNDEELLTLFGNDINKIKQEKDRIDSFKLSEFDGFPNEKQKFLKLKAEVIGKLDKLLN